MRKMTHRNVFQSAGHIATSDTNRMAFVVDVTRGEGEGGEGRHNNTNCTLTNEGCFATFLTRLENCPW